MRARLVGEDGRGVRTIIRMVNHTRLDCLIGSASSMRWGVVQAAHHARHRAAFGRRLADQPLMQNVLADLAIESEAATAAALRVARAYDEGDSPFRRLATAVMKHWVCKRAPWHATEALECLGGNGYVEESGMPRLLRDSPLNSIWEGSGNVSALDVLRALAREPETLPAFLAECELARGANSALDAHLDRLRETAPADPEFEARRVVADLALALQAGLLVQHCPARGLGRLLRRAARGHRRACLRDPAAAGGRCRDRRARAARLSRTPRPRYSSKRPAKIPNTAPCPSWAMTTSPPGTENFGTMTVPPVAAIFSEAASGSSMPK